MNLRVLAEEKPVIMKGIMNGFINMQWKNGGERDRQTDGQTDRDRQTDGDTDRKQQTETDQKDEWQTV